ASAGLRVDRELGRADVLQAELVPHGRAPVDLARVVHAVVHLEDGCRPYLGRRDEEEQRKDEPHATPKSHDARRWVKLHPAPVRRRAHLYPYAATAASGDGSWQTLGRACDEAAEKGVKASTVQHGVR